MHRQGEALHAFAHAVLREHMRPEAYISILTCSISGLASYSSAVRKTTVLDVMRRLTQTKNIMVSCPSLRSLPWFWDLPSLTRARVVPGLRID
jgi:hypothetical protein